MPNKNITLVELLLVINLTNARLSIKLLSLLVISIYLISIWMYDLFIFTLFDWGFLYYYQLVTLARFGFYKYL